MQIFRYLVNSFLFNSTFLHLGGMKSQSHSKEIDAVISMLIAMFAKVGNWTALDIVHWAIYAFGRLPHKVFLFTLSLAYWNCLGLLPDTIFASWPCFLDLLLVSQTSKLDDVFNSRPCFLFNSWAQGSTCFSHPRRRLQATSDFSLNLGKQKVFLSVFFNTAVQLQYFKTFPSLRIQAKYSFSKSCVSNVTLYHELDQNCETFQDSAIN